MPVFPWRRAARFADLVDQPPLLRRQQPVDPELADLADLTDDLRRIDDSKATMRPEFRDQLRAKLVATAAAQGIGATATPVPTRIPPPRIPARVAYRSRVAIGIGVAAGVAGVAGLGAAAVSDTALPGDGLYTVKRSAEEAKLAVALSDADRGELYLDFARNRMREASSVLTDADRVRTLLADMDADTVRGVELLATAAVADRNSSHLDHITGFLDDQTADLDRLLGRTSGAVHDRTGQSLDLLGNARDRLYWLRAALSCPDALTGQSDNLGPVPRVCQPRPVNGPAASPSPGTGAGMGVQGVQGVPAGAVPGVPPAPAGKTGTPGPQPQPPVAPTPTLVPDLPDLPGEEGKDKCDKGKNKNKDKKKCQSPAPKIPLQRSGD